MGMQIKRIDLRPHPPASGGAEHMHKVLTSNNKRLFYICQV
jgi:hypothetical protein